MWIAAVHLLLIPHLAIGQPESPPAAVTIRAVDQRMSGEVIRFVAANTEPAFLDPGNFDVDSTQTPHEIIERRCGSVRPEYYEEFLRSNGLTQLAADVPIRERARTLIWPSCLYVRPADNGVTAVVAENDSADKVYTRLTGGHATKKELERFFGAAVSTLKKLQPGDVLKGRHLTAAVRVVPTGPDADQFEEELTALVEADPQTKVRTVTEQVGEIVLPMEGDPNGGIASGSTDCIASGPPFDVGQVRKAFAYSRGRRRELRIFPGQADVLIVDNGFQGADPNANPIDPFVGSPFAMKFFQGADEGTIARKITIGTAHWPINTRIGIAGSPVRGHGTHVAGLALGGPGFAEDRQTSEDTEVWARLTMLNVSGGERTLAEGAVDVLKGVLGVPEEDRIVNMSISYDGDMSSDIATLFDGMVHNGDNTLFLVAAGNRSRDVSGDIYPAALGGPQSTNVITVAAIGGDGRLTAFTNFGPKTVDIAAPGCLIRSWLDNSADETPLSGTSQATPIVTFAASLLHSLVPKSTPAILKTRLVTSGDLMHSDDHGKTAYRVRLNIPKALYLFDDYVTTRGEQGATYIGTATRVTGMRCAADSPQAIKDLNAIWSIKRSGNRLWLYAGRNTGTTGRAEEPCEAADPGAGRLRFTPRYRVTDSMLEAVPPADELELPIADVVELVMRSRFMN